MPPPRRPEPGGAPAAPRPAPADQPYGRRNRRVVAAARLHRRRDREAVGRFLVEGPQAVREALRRPGTVHELFVTAAARRRHPDLVDAAGAAAAVVSTVAEEALAALAGTPAPQGLVAVCGHLDVPLTAALARARLAAILVEARDPGNAGTVLRTADAAGAHTVVFAGDAVDPYNGKCVRATAGSLFHVDVVRCADPWAALDAARAAGLRVLAATGHGDTDLDALADTGELAGPTAWLFGSEAHGLPAPLAAAADRRIRVPIHGRAESLNLAAAAAVCLYASASALRHKESPP